METGSNAPDQSWLRYANQGATRNQPLRPDLVRAMSFLPEMGITMEVFSGGQDGKGEGDRRTGSTRHDHGGAADAFFYKDGRKLDWANPDDQPIFAQIVQRAKASGITGIGAGDGYMRPGSMHVGFGNSGVWGEGGSGANAAPWLRSAYGGAPAGQPPSQPQGQGYAQGPMTQPGQNPLGQPMQQQQQPQQNQLAQSFQPFVLNEADFMNRRNPLAVRPL